MEGLILRYYDAEICYLREVTKEFAQVHPDRAAMLDPDEAGTPDPYVERLFEGLTFSMGRLRVKIDDHLPEFTEGLMSLLWPYYLRTTPSSSTVELPSDIDVLKMSERINAKSGVLPQPVSPEKTVCRYRTTQSVILNPLFAAAVNIDVKPDGCSVIRMRIKCNPQMDWLQTDLTRPSLYLSGDTLVTHTLYLALTERLASLYLRFPNSVERIRLEGFFSSGGFADEDSLWPKGDTAFGGWQLLLEYFMFREKFMLVHLNGLEGISFPAGIDCFEIEAVLTQQWSSELPAGSENICLYCVPVISLSTIEANPLVVNSLESEYLLRPRRLRDGHTEIYAIDAASGS